MKKLKVTVDGQIYEVEVEALDAPSTATAAPAAAGSDDDVPSPLAGKVVETQVSVGDVVSEGDTLIVLEAMKMNTLVSSPSSGTIVAVLVDAGDMVEEGEPLVSIG